MALYIKRQWPRILGITLPFFLLLILVGVGVSIFPNNTLYGLPGDTCTFNSIENCDPCNGEFCAGSACANYDDQGTINFNPAITDPQCPEVNNELIHPDCYNICQRLNINSGSMDEFECLQNHQFCDTISGGDQMSECREGVCTDNEVRDTGNPTGCDFDYLGRDSDPLCMNCENATEAQFDNCGNGVCEVVEGEDCVTCAVDCLVPGFEDVCPVQGVIGACINLNITFPGPPYNNLIGQPVEDGDLCTDNSCDLQTESITSTPKSCSIDQVDFCCPAGCQAPPDGLSCVEAINNGDTPRDECDIDCYLPEMCLVPIPTPTPTPSDVILEGSGCTLHKAPLAPGGSELLGLVSLGLALGGLLAFRRRARRN